MDRRVRRGLGREQGAKRPEGDPKDGCKPEGAEVRAEPSFCRWGSRCHRSHRLPRAPIKSRVTRLNSKPRPFKCLKRSLAQNRCQVQMRSLLLNLFLSPAARRRSGGAPGTPSVAPWRLGFFILHVAMWTLPSPGAGETILRGRESGSFDFLTQ